MREVLQISMRGSGRRMKKLSVDNPFFDFMGRLGDVVLLNVLFLVSSLPVVTMGASFAALYQSFDDMAEGKLISAFRNFSSAWKKNLKTSTRAWLLILLSGCLLVFDLTFVGGMRRGTGLFWKVTGIGIGCLLMLWEMVFCYVFPVILKGETRIGEMVKRSLFLAVRNFPYTLLMIILNSVPAICFVLGGNLLAAVLPLYLVFGFGLTAFVNTFFLRRCI